MLDQRGRSNIAAIKVGQCQLAQGAEEARHHAQCTRCSLQKLRLCSREHLEFVGVFPFFLLLVLAMNGFGDPKVTLEVREDTQVRLQTDGAVWLLDVQDLFSEMVVFLVPTHRRNVEHVSAFRSDNIFLVESLLLIVIISSVNKIAALLCCYYEALVANIEDSKG